jgi:CBS domain-containing protein
VALAGPAVSVGIALALFAALTLTASFRPLSELGVAEGPVIERLMLVNIILAAFNMLPAFPMDGGRVLRALLAMRLEYTRATQIAASIGQGSAFLFGLLGLFINPFLVFIALFVWIGAAQEASMVQMKSALSGIPVGSVMRTDFSALAPGDSLGRAVETTVRRAQPDFPVVTDGDVVGVLTRDDLLRALSERGPQSAVADVMRRQFEIVDSFDMLDAAFARLQTCECHTLPVTHDGRLVGLVSMEGVGEFLRVQAALHPLGARH